MIKSLIAIVCCVGIIILFWLIPSPEGLDVKAWRLLGVFLATIAGLILRPFPMGVVALTALVFCILSALIDEKKALIGFSNPVLWLTIVAFFLSHGFTETSLGRRLALIFIRLFGRSSLGLSYGMALSDLLMAPAIPSVTARSAGVIFPILTSISTRFRSFPHSFSSHKLGGFLTVTAFQISVVTSAMFMTSMSANPLIASLLGSQGVPISWLQWAKAAIVPGLISIALIPLLIYKLYPPAIKKTPGAIALAKSELNLMGKLRYAEKVVLGTILVVILLWVFGGIIGVNTLTAAFIGLLALLITKVISWRKILSDESAWHIYIWFGVLLTLVNELNHLALFSWFNDISSNYLQGFDYRIGFPLLILLYFYSHYFFASCTVHISVMFVPFFTLSQVMATPPMLAALSLMFASNLYGGLTHYSLTPAPLLFGAGYVRLGTWWTVGFVVSLLNLLIWGGIGFLWWQIAGFKLY